MKEEEVKNLIELLNERTMKLMERESELADNLEEIEAQKEELTAAVEELIGKNKELVERNQELDQILYRASHDLRSPISSMVGVLNLIKTEQIPSALKDYCYHFEMRINQMEGVVNTLNLLGQSAQEEIKITKIEIKELVENEIKLLHYLPNFKFIQFEIIHLGSSAVETDSVLLGILVKSLLTNAIIFREATPGSVWVNTNVQDDQLIIKIIDDGEGISPTIAPRIFEMFYRGSEKSIGQGMGLYLVKKILSRLKGKVKWQCENNLTTFEVSIPIIPILIS